MATHEWSTASTHELSEPKSARTSGEFPNAERACGEVLALPIYPELADDAVDRICDEVRAFFAGAPR